MDDDWLWHWYVGRNVPRVDGDMTDKPNAETAAAIRELDEGGGTLRSGETKRIIDEYVAAHAEMLKRLAKR